MENLILNGIWKLTELDNDQNMEYEMNMGYEMNIPGDVHSTLIRNGEIEDPYFGKNELDSLWVNITDYKIEKEFEFYKKTKRVILSLKFVDTFTSIFINNKLVGETDNEFAHFYFDIAQYLKEGKNKITIIFHSAENIAAEKNSKLPYPIPCSRYPNDSPYRNLNRKSQCNAGWDWGPCIMSMGIYEPIELIETDDIYIANCAITTHKENKEWVLLLDLDIDSTIEKETKVTLSLMGSSITFPLSIKAEAGLYSLDFPLTARPKLWWPAGYGEQPLYDAKVEIENFIIEKKFAFRTLEVRNKESMGGKELTVVVNGKAIFMKGANWIPQDALPERITKERYQYLIHSMKECNMNMVRVWGGGIYEHDDFYSLCDEEGILVWQDLMFSCSTYPSSQDFLDSVEDELYYQIIRLKSHPSIALWCGNNEDLGALTWYEETIKNRDRYVIDFDRLNNITCGRTVKELDPDRIFWPSSPCAGPGDFSDNWHLDGKGDMHYWAVWHEGKDFEAYQTIKPRFCSEFGYQSFPSYSTALSFAPDDLNLTSPVFEHHQKNPKGNTIIIENFTRYFRFPSSFKNMLYLSMAQQAWAISTAVTYWRSLMPYCMGTLYWQLNDVWPVSSWSSIEYSGKWKPLQFEAKRFYAPIAPLLYIDNERIYVDFINDSKKSDVFDYTLTFSNYDGEVVKKIDDMVYIKSNSVTKALSFSLNDFDITNTYLSVSLYDENHEEQRFLFLDKPKNCNIKEANIRYMALETADEDYFCIALKANSPCFWLFLDTDEYIGDFSDNFFSMNKDDEMTVYFKRKNKKITVEEFEKKLRIYDLYSSSK